MLDHEIYMRRCLELAALGAGYVSPNPMVGAVIVHEGKIIGEGYHRKYGQAHAEVQAIDDVYKNVDKPETILSKSKIYVSLEPCAHHGKTPPCADRIIKEGIPEVVVGCRDSFSEVNGRGIAKLRDAGVRVTESVLAKECLWLNRRFFTRIMEHRPYVILKWAQTPSAIFTTENGTQSWITGEESRRLVHQWRAEEDCVLVGRNTVLHDNPRLNVRYGNGRQPARAIIDGNLTLSRELHVFDQQQDTFVFNRTKTDIDGRIKYIGIEDYDYFLPQYILYQLYLQDISSVIIEGGIQTLNTFIRSGLWDEARIFTGKNEIQNGRRAPEISGKQIEEIYAGEDRLQVFVPHKSCFDHAV
ncbi:MAG: bifunctional diaminohydroxyphosphoribosylaminopyrimidine deaminase/5-amino-6-(5-phosphoribosylamino)uracil reductase RibD [Mucilaginibacter polytrichastri]|nr:bifunctional diaminohydroxyphosphoribosylaminopyrimidine deaminase/5-amino-6-(5-phosphoribosylamino)uracil reductase RibD [Mucilaginibacter polytrichastri]